ncbi:tRNA (adenosine(37)-N6)-threonylcarbamoyltransferase complex transferase subunit TsaD [bacterium]|nr:tRNA (adenosine(37)-N6)-threonylcarbamoyltransferase complex transferase subunit TsaD [bacterium]
MIVLGIETSCDDTAAALYRPGRQEPFSEIVSRQYQIHDPYGGVVPELASRSHLEALPHITEELLKKENLKLSDVDLIAATAGPGLAGALIVGLSFAKSLALAAKKPFVAVNHIEAHMFAATAAEKVEYPFLALVISGGHTLLAHVKSPEDYAIIGRTRDDAAGEALDKGAKILGFPMPGGVNLAKAAERGQRGTADGRRFPRSYLKPSYDFSFSGVKTALLYHVERTKPGSPEAIDNIAADYVEAIMDVLVKKTLLAARELGLETIVVGGGVSANSRLRELFNLRGRARGKQMRVVFPPFPLCTDNARMIAARGLQTYQDKGPSKLDADVFSTFIN